MLSGIKVGRTITPQLHTSISVYHSFYLNSFKATADLAGFDKQPRLFINGVGGELEYKLFGWDKLSCGVQLFLGWGFMNYELKSYDFKSDQVDYIAIEPAINTEYKISNATFIGLALSYRPILTKKEITYTSNVSAGEIPISKALPNGINIILSIKGLL